LSLLHPVFFFFLGFICFIWRLANWSQLLGSVVNKDLTFKAKAKAKDLTSEQVEGPL